MIEEQEVTLKLIDIKNLYEFCMLCMGKEGLNAKLSYTIYKNQEILESVYAELSQGIYNPENDPEMRKYYEKNNRLVMKYIDRNEQGEMIFDDDGKTPRITEMIVEYQKEKTKLDTENENVLKESAKKMKMNGEFLNTFKTIRIFKLSLSDIPDKTPPAIVGLLAIL